MQWSSPQKPYQSLCYQLLNIILIINMWCEEKQLKSCFILTQCTFTLHSVLTSVSFCRDSRVEGTLSRVEGTLSRVQIYLITIQWLLLNNYYSITDNWKTDRQTDRQDKTRQDRQTNEKYKSELPAIKAFDSSQHFLLIKMFRRQLSQLPPQKKTCFRIAFAARARLTFWGQRFYCASTMFFASFIATPWILRLI